MPSIVVSAALRALRPLTAVPVIEKKPPMATPARPIQATSITGDTSAEYGCPDELGGQIRTAITAGGHYGRWGV